MKIVLQVISAVQYFILIYYTQLLTTIKLLTDLLRRARPFSYTFSFCGASVPIPALASLFTKLRDYTQTLVRIFRTSEQTLRTTSGNKQHSEETDIQALDETTSQIPESERTQTHALDIPATGIGLSVIYSLYLAIRKTK